MTKNRIIFSVLLCLTSHLYAADFGSSGSNGYSGDGGYDGNNGESVSLLVEGKALELRLDGEDGTPGKDGGNGESASGCYFSEGTKTQYGAPGGSAGHGGDGGRGGHGGDAHFFIKDFKNLSNVFLSQVGGKGAPGGKPGVKGRGCDCHTSSWTAQTCNTTRSCSSSGGCSSSTSCTDRTFHCVPGQDGYAGSPGAQGSDGSMGDIWIIQNLQVLPQEAPSASVSIKTFNEEALTLSKLIWENKTGAKKLFASGSNIKDRYSLFIKKAERKVKLKWASGREISDFQHEKLDLSFDGEKIKVTYSGSHLIQFKLEESADQTTVVIEKSFRKEDLLLVSLNGIEGTYEKTMISLKDLSNFGSLIKNKVMLTFSYKHWLKGWTTVFDGYMPEELVSATNNEIKIHVGGLDVKDKVLKSGSKVRFEVKLTRSIETMSSNVSIPQAEDAL